MKNGFKKQLKKQLNKNLLIPALSVALLVPAVTPAYAAASKSATIKSVEFIGTDAPTTAENMAKVYITAKAKVTFSDGSVQTYPLTYNTIMKSTTTFNGMAAGTPIDVNGKPIMDSSKGTPVPYISDGPDANALLHVNGKDSLSLLTHYEYITVDNAGKSAYGLVPASMTLSDIEQDKQTGALKATALKKVDFSSVDGLWIPCNGSLTPWNTFLSSEEYDADARAYEADNSKTFVSSFAEKYFGDAKKGNPYAYGFLPEVTVHKDNSTTVVKHYSMGRFSHELGKIAPDRKTAFFGDDGGNTMLFMYVADKAEDLSAGTLYAAKWMQKSADNGGSADLKWIKLGTATDNEIKSYIDKGIKFSDIFETADKDTEGFTKIKTYPSGKVEWLKVKPGMEKAAAFLESRRYGAMLGATSEFNKMEGVAVNSKDKKVYVAMSYMEKAMEKDSKGQDPTDDIQIKKIKAGVTYELTLKGGQKDSGNNYIDSNYVPSFMQGLIVGEDLKEADQFGNTAAVDKVANPDNLFFSEKLRTLFIGEDSGMHANNYLWAYNIETQKLSRILSLPAGAESTGLSVVDNMNGYTYILGNVQHPGDEMLLPEPLKSEVDALINKNFDNKKAGLVGYIGGLPFNDPMLKASDAAKDHSIDAAWDNHAKQLTLRKNGNTLVVKQGQSTATLNGIGRTLTMKVENVNGRIMIPESILMELLNN
ncbi:alkaline phosphatase PhoX [Ferviditalea candida]|uniref:Alkaline phosphatase PhoX n=1 Tax=Ferviditalea candida TaxID=3108399 RepID=A0ABU5ZJ02_9BACL|nr:alkaline phosphatase PhoX [Paenibacillaceae bacterium T2]